MVIDLGPSAGPSADAPNDPPKFAGGNGKIYPAPAVALSMWTAAGAEMVVGEIIPNGTFVGGGFFDVDDMCWIAFWRQSGTPNNLCEDIECQKNNV